MEWMDGVKRALNERVMSVEQGRMMHDTSEWRAVVNTSNNMALMTCGGDSRTSGVTHGADRVQGKRGE